MHSHSNERVPLRVEICRASLAPNRRRKRSIVDIRPYLPTLSLVSSQQRAGSVPAARPLA
jgi:hypothetical protein